MSQNPKLLNLECSYNQISSLNTSQSPNFETLGCIDNQLTDLDLA